MTRRGVLLAVAGALAMCMVQAVAVGQDRITKPIAKSGLAVDVVDFMPVRSDRGQKGDQSHINFLFHAGDGSHRMFVADSRGNIFVIEGGRLLPEPFLDVAAVRGPAFLRNGRELGLRTFAFHPQFARAGTPGFGRFYTATIESAASAEGGGSGTRLFAAPGATIDHYDVIAEWTIDTAKPNRIDPTSRREVLRIAQPYDEHNTSQLGFNPNAGPGDADYGMLYIGVGDGGNTYKLGMGVDSSRRGQDGGTPLGKILRVDPLRDGAEPYTVPADNPFLGDPTMLPEIWALGLRNPQYFSWDTGGDGKMLIGDIGQAGIEEINLGAAGANYGWSEREGTFAVDRDNEDEFHLLPPDDASRGFTYPVAQYDHDEGDAIVGGFVYRGETVPDLYGKYIFGDLVRGRIFYVDADDLADGRQTVASELTLLRNGIETTLLDIVGDTRADLRFGMDEDGEIYILTKRDGMIRAWYQPF